MRGNFVPASSELKRQNQLKVKYFENVKSEIINIMIKIAPELILTNIYLARHRQ